MAKRNKPSGATREERDRISLGRIESYIDALAGSHLSCPTCKKEMNVNDLRDIPTSVATLMRARYDKLRPTLSAVEQTIIDPRDKADPAELKRQLVAMFDANPSLFDEIQALRAAASTQQPEQSSDEQRVTH